MNSEFSFKTSSHTVVKEPSLLLYLLKTVGRIVRFLLFPRVLASCEMQIALSKIWTWVTVSISNDDNYYTINTSLPSRLGLQNTLTASLQSGKTPPQQVSWIWHETSRVSSNCGALGNAEYPFIAIAPRSTLAWSSSTW